MVDLNKHIYDYLDYYCSMSSAPEFGVLLKGEWGSGKTWFVRKFIEEKQEIKFIYVSLYGVTSFAEIEDEFFRQLHPKLSSKGMRLTGKILKGVIKTAIKVDFDGDGKVDGAVNSQIPDVNFPEYLTNIDNHVLIFDDLERCKIDYENVLGYINHFVEHQGFKVIVLANEDELEKRAIASKIEYRLIKEKLIGKTFQIAPSVGSAIDDFISKLSHAGARKFLQENKAQISTVYSLSDFNNLRILKQSLWDFERIYEALPEKAIAKDELVQKILALSLALSLEVRAGLLSSTEILELQPDWLTEAMAEAGGNRETTASKKFTEKYKSLEPSRPIPAAPFWSEYLGKGVIDHAVLVESIDNSAYFISDATPNWVKLWHFMDLQDDEFERISKEVKSEFDSNSYKEIGEIKHVVGIFLWLSEIGLFSLEKGSFIELAKQYVNALIVNNELLNQSSDLGTSLGDSMGYAGLGFHGNDLPEFRGFSDYIKSVQTKARQESMPQAANELIEIMKSDVKKFSRMITVSNSDDQIYCNTPILNYLDANKFLSSLLEMQPEYRRWVAYALEARYQFVNSDSKLIDELDWLKEVGSLLEVKAEKMQGKLTGYALNAIGDEVNKVISKLEQTQTSGAKG